MEREILEKIELGRQFMDAELLTKAEKFRQFNENYRPVVTVLCSDNRLLMQMEKITADCREVDFHICGTFNGIEEVIEKATFSDAIIVNTLALKISPEGLYNVLKAVEKLNKEVYFILSGWESIPKTPEFCKKKLAQIDKEFPFVRIKASQNVFTKPIDGFSFIEDVTESYIERITKTFDFVHGVQVEAVYRQLAKEIQKFRHTLYTEIQKEQALVLQIQSSFLAKQKRCSITFSHATVNVNDTLSRFEKTVKEIDINDVICSLETTGISARESFLENPENAERQAKICVYDKIDELIDSFVASAVFTDTISSQTNSQIDNTVSDLLSLTNRLSKCRFIDNMLIDELVQTIKNTDMLLNSARNYNNSVITVLDRARKSIRSKILGFRFEEPQKNIVQNLIKGIIDKKDTAEKNESEEENAEILWTHFCNEIQRLISYAKTVLSELIADNSRMTNKDIDIQSKNTINSYFGFITEKTDLICESLKKQLDDYSRCDL